MKLRAWLMGMLFVGPVAHAAPLQIMAGAVSGGGGKGVVCQNAAGAIGSVEVLDLWEARELYGKSLAPLSGDLAIAVDQALQRLANSYPYFGSGSFGDDHYENQEYILFFMRNEATWFLRANDRVRRLRGVRLSPTDDSFELARPANCEIEQIVNYQLNGKILVNQDLFEKLDLSNQAALIAHEAHYAMLKSFAGETNSIRTRRSIGHVFGGESFEAPVREPHTTGLSCVSDEWPNLNHLILTRGITEDGKQKLNFEPIFLGGSALMGTGPLRSSIIPSPGVVDQIFSGKCGNFGVYGIGTTVPGPIEYDRSVRVHISCSEGSLRVSLEHTAPGRDRYDKSLLSCEPISK